MKDFVKLYTELDKTTSQNAKVLALAKYFSNTNISDQDKLWTVALFSHRRPPRAVNSTKIREWSAELAGLPLWLFEETYHIVGDLAETIALVSPNTTQEYQYSLSERISHLNHLKTLVQTEEQKQLLFSYWLEMNKEERFLFNKLLTGGFRVGISQNLIIKALAQSLSKADNEIALMLTGDWSPDKSTWDQLMISSYAENAISKPFPFYLAYALDKPLDELGNVNEWAAEYKWDGIRGQIIIRNNQVFIWSRGEELVTERFPEFQVLSKLEQNIVLDGEIVVMHEAIPSNFNQLQTRIGRKSLSKKLLAETPVKLIAYDLLELDGEDLRSYSYEHRRNLLKEVYEGLKHYNVIKLSEIFTYNDWNKFSSIRDHAANVNAEGIMLKKKSSTYQVGRKKGDWYKWKLDPYTVDAVMIYANRGHGRRANLYTDFTFAIYDADRKLVPFAKAYSGLTDAEFNEVTTWVKNNTIEKFGPVCSVKAALVFELAFEGIALSNRHKSGIALRFPRIKTWRKDKPIDEIDTVENLKKLIKI
ncbi:MAG TPA: ATP-dependent DNA ligase [Saprospiraceae bacterium]|nr:ATP-dependent DNA ligase [Saprospiraceae bacterium]